VPRKEPIIMGAVNWSIVVGRQIPYWFTLLMTAWTLLFMYVSIFDKGGVLYDNLAASVR
jgi:hypothetical protein